MILSLFTRILTAAENSNGFRWLVRVVEFGTDKNGSYWDRDTLTAALAKFEGAKVFALAEAQHQAKTHPFGKSVRDLVGVLQGATADDKGIYATLIILPAAQWLRDNLVGCSEQGMTDVIGLSVDITGKIATKQIDNKQQRYLASIKNVTVDVVYDPAAGGEFIGMAASNTLSQEEDTMLLQKLLAALKKSRPALHKEIDDGMQAGTITEDQAIDRISAALVIEAGGSKGTSDTEFITAAVVAGMKELLGSSESEELKEVKLLACTMTLDRELASSKLPEAAQENLRGQFGGRLFESDELKAAIKSTKEMLDKLNASGQVQDSGSQRIQVGRESGERLQAAMDGLFNVPLADNMRDVPVFTSIRAAYVEMTSDTDITGVLNPSQLRRMQAAYGDTTFAYALGNTLYRRLVNDYRELYDYGISRIVGGNIRNARDFRKLESIRIGYYGDLPDVDTDTQDYPDLGEVSDEKVEYAINEKGGIITIGRRMIINDDVRVIQKIVSRLPRAARRTLAKRVWNLFINNATYKGDNKAIFHADHGNLGSAAYDNTTALAARKAFFDQAEPGSGEKLALRPATVVFPSDLYATVKNLNEFNSATAIASHNTMYGYFKPEGLIESPFMTDANDWMMFGDPNEAEIVELSFLNGQQEPQMLVADNPSVGQMFVGGRIQYRITHDYECDCTDYRNAYKAVVA